MAWVCGACLKWFGREALVCDICQRPKSGRLCLTCKTSVAADAAYCATCAGNRLTPAAVPLNLVVTPRLRLALAVGAPVLAFSPIWGVRVLLYWLKPVIVSLCVAVIQGAIVIATWFVVMWFGLGAAPSPYRERWRGWLFWWARILGRLVVNAFRL